jgi:hypothetical protein
MYYVLVGINDIWATEASDDVEALTARFWRRYTHDNSVWGSLLYIVRYIGLIAWMTQSRERKHLALYLDCYLVKLNAHPKPAIEFERLQYTYIHAILRLQRHLAKIPSL